MFSKIFKLILLIGVTITIFIIPTVNAQEISSANSAKIITASPLPDLNFNNSQDKVAAMNELSPGKDIQIQTSIHQFETK